MRIITRNLIFVCLLAASSRAQDLTARQVLDKVVSTYNSFTAVHMIFERDETRYLGSRSATSSSECEIAAKSNHKYFVRLKQLHEQMLSLSDGSTIWKAVDSKKQWCRLTASAITGERGDEEQSGGPPAGDLHHAMESIMLYRPLALAKDAQDAEIVKQPDFKLGHEKVRGYLIRAHSRETEFELLVDQQRFVVLEYKVKASATDGKIEAAMKAKLVELNEEVSDSLFHFEPDPKWTEVESLVLPGERLVMLTGERAADFTLKTLDGDTVGLRSLQGNVVVLDFWATWCGPCRAELPTIEKLRSEFAGAVRFYGVNDEAPGIVKKFAMGNRYEMPILLDEHSQVHRLYGIHAIPALMVIGRDSVVRAQFLGTQSESTLRKAIRAALEQK
ncbi:MAG: redoxin domain-containing protein [Bryobacteraceae bacterium]